MALDTLHDLMIDELKDLYSAESQLLKALPKMVEGATTPSLKKAIGDHLEQTKNQVKRLDQIFETLGVSPRGKKCKAMEGLCEEGAEMVEEEGEDVVRDAGIIASAQRVEHYEIAAYGSTIAFARLLGHDEIVTLLEATLEEEKAADSMLTKLAESEINVAANAMSDEDASEDDEEEDASASKRTGSSTKTADATKAKTTAATAGRRK